MKQLLILGNFCVRDEKRIESFITLYQMLKIIRLDEWKLRFTLNAIIRTSRIEL